MLLCMLALLQNKLLRAVLFLLMMGMCVCVEACPVQLTLVSENIWVIYVQQF